MISVIICSVNPELSEEIIKNIGNTIGIPHEILVFDNRQASLKIAEVYNRQAQLAKYSYLVFVHEDIAFHSPGWGAHVIESLNLADVGMVGICGGKYYPAVPCSWIDIPHEFRRAGMLSRQDGELVTYDSRDNVQRFLSETKTLDGLFLAMKKTTWQQFRFNTYQELDFHFYDIDLSLRVGQKLRLVVDHRILPEHFSTGKFDKQWLKDAFAFYKLRCNPSPLYHIAGRREPALDDFAVKRMMERTLECRSSYYLLKLFKAKPLLFLKNTIFLLKLLFEKNGNKIQV